MLRFVKFTLPNSSNFIYINGSLVRTVRAVSVKNYSQSLLAFTLSIR